MAMRAGASTRRQAGLARVLKSAIAARSVEAMEDTARRTKPAGRRARPRSSTRGPAMERHTARPEGGVASNIPILIE